MHLVPRLPVAAILLASLAAAPKASAQSNEPAVVALVARAMRADLGNKWGARAARAKLDLAKRICGHNCSKAGRTALHIGYGSLAAVARQHDEARKQFTAALTLNPGARLPPKQQHTEVKAAFAQAKAAQNTGGTKVARTASTDEKQGGTKTTKTQDKRHSLVECDKGTTEDETPNGWSSARSFCYYAEAVSSEAAQAWPQCADYVSRSLDTDERIESRVLFAQCLEGGGKLRDALAAYRDLTQRAMTDGLTQIELEARARAKILRTRIPKLVIRVPVAAPKLRVLLNGQVLDAGRLGGEIWLDPGPHRITADGEIGREKVDFEELVILSERQRKTLMIAATAPSRDDKKPRELTLRLEGEFSGYLDTDAVEVATPSISISAEHPTNGWGLGAFFLVDVVTAASADIVATASPRWTEVRYVPGVSAHNMFGALDVAVNATVSVEPDYLAIGSGLGLTTNFRQKMITPTLRYDFGYDISGRAGTPFSVSSEKIHRHGITGGASLVLNKHSIFAPSFTAVLEWGDTSKPYRFLPTFAPDTTVAKGETIDSVNRKRRPTRISDQVPVKRQRYALAGLYARRYSKLTLRIAERLYADSWGVMSTTTDMLLPWDISRHVRVWPHVRFYAQTGASFWKRAYVVETTPAGLNVPLLRTGDRELGPMLAGTAGAAARFEFGKSTTGRSFGLTIKADAVYARFLNHLFTRGRFGVFGGATGEVVFR